MPPLGVVVHLNVPGDLCLGIRPVFEGPIPEQLSLEAAEAGPIKALSAQLMLWRI
jgi:hypothetical protein